ncbi:hypothetical protein Ddye_013660 [Dipteronia dyeriana]|uniref:Uncharacterized protein n=1 Tax=Dipteronia dyeriana TaxID=168575 RepID=A0AAD9X6T0_9ROSI|nr:hypothetical protein Ddye_013660 [Dipteronia dyeriana]
MEVEKETWKILKFRPLILSLLTKPSRSLGSTLDLVASGSNSTRPGMFGARDWIGLFHRIGLDWTIFIELDLIKMGLRLDRIGPD